MSPNEARQSYVTHGTYTDPGAHDALLTGLPADVAGLCRIIQGVLIQWQSGRPARADRWAVLAEEIDRLEPAERAAQRAEIAAQSLLWSS